MDATFWSIVGIAVMVVSLFLIPIGFPGIWVMVVVLGIGAYYHQVGLFVLFLSAALGLAAELAEYGVTKRMTTRYGGTRRAFWGAIVGWFVGVIVGIPIPVAGSVIAGMLGSFAGALLVSYAETRDLPAAGRVGWGVLLGRVASMALKTAAAVVVLTMGVWSLLLR